MKCPACDHHDAYTGLQWVHCRNTECRYFDRKYDEKRAKEELGDYGLIDLAVLGEPEPSEHDQRVQKLRDMMSGKTKRP